MSYVMRNSGIFVKWWIRHFGGIGVKDLQRFVKQSSPQIRSMICKKLILENYSFFVIFF